MSFLFHFLFEVPFLSFWSFWGHCLSFLRQSHCTVFLAVTFFLCVGGETAFLLFLSLFWGNISFFPLVLRSLPSLIAPNSLCSSSSSELQFPFCAILSFFLRTCVFFSSFLFWGHCLLSLRCAVLLAVSYNPSLRRICISKTWEK